MSKSATHPAVAVEQHEVQRPRPVDDAATRRRMIDAGVLVPEQHTTPTFGATLVIDDAGIAFAAREISAAHRWQRLQEIREQCDPRIAPRLTRKAA